MNGAVIILQEPPGQPDVVALIEALDAYATALYPPESNHLLDVASLSDPAVSFLVARAEGEAVGCGAILRDPRGWGEVKRMFVRPDQRGKGIGVRMLAELEALAIGSGLSLLERPAFATAKRWRSTGAPDLPSADRSAITRRTH